jgi:hypothetical protein
MLAIGLLQPDGTVRQLAGYHLAGVNERLAALAAERLRDEDSGTPPATWH